jgi:ribulose 1,5-bisphosphate synthetase/thiazole synthase
MPGDLDQVIVGGGPNGLTAVALSSAGMRILMTQEPATPGDGGPVRLALGGRAAERAKADVSRPRVPER